MNTCRRYSEEELSGFEGRWAIVLPREYHVFLRTIGCTGPDGLSLLEEWHQPHQVEVFPPDFLCSPFPHHIAWNDRSLLRDARGWASAYYSHDLWRGSIRIRNTGCEGYDMLVVSGPSSGRIWHDDRACGGGGIYPVQTSLVAYLGAAARGSIGAQ